MTGSDECACLTGKHVIEFTIILDAHTLADDFCPRHSKSNLQQPADLGKRLLEEHSFICLSVMFSSTCIGLAFQITQWVLGQLLH